MVSLLLAVVLSGVPTEHRIEQNYAEAYQQSIKDHKPLMVVVGAPWCRACSVLKESTILPMAETGELDNCSLIHISEPTRPY